MAYSGSHSPYIRDVPLLQENDIVRALSANYCSMPCTRLQPFVPHPFFSFLHCILKLLPEPLIPLLVSGLDPPEFLRPG